MPMQDSSPSISIDPVDQQERIAVRQDRQDLPDVSGLDCRRLSSSVRQVSSRSSPAGLGRWPPCGAARKRSQQLHLAEPLRAPAWPACRPSGRPAGTSSLTLLVAAICAPSPMRDVIVDADTCRRAPRNPPASTLPEIPVWRDDDAMATDRPRCGRSGRGCRSWCPRRSRCRGWRRGRSCVLAPISTSSWMMTRPTCGTLRWPLALHHEAEPVLPDAAAGMDDRRGCRSARAMSVRRRRSRSRGRCGHAARSRRRRR